MPNGPAQQALLRQALAAAKLQPADIDYVEAHGTGTPLGDPIELEALSKVFAERTDSQPLILGSVKTNLGHLEAAAGVAGFIKTVLAVRHGYIPRHLNFTELTPYATDSAACVTIASSGQGWPSSGRPRRAGVSSFGVSGTNAHVVVEQAPELVGAAKSPESVSPVCTLVVSGKTPERVAATAGMLARWMAGAGSSVGLAEVAHALNHHRTLFRPSIYDCRSDNRSAHHRHHPPCRRNSRHRRAAEADEPALWKKLRPGSHGRVGLAELINELVAGFERRHPDTHIHYSTGRLAKSYGEPIDLADHCCVQEGITNAIRARLRRQPHHRFRRGERTPPRRGKARAGRPSPHRRRRRQGN